MGQYISLYLENKQNNYENIGLREIIEYIGRAEDKNKHKQALSSEDAYKYGKKVINARLNKWHLTAIDKLVYADKEKRLYNSHEKSFKAVWKIHKNKGKKIFFAIQCILNTYPNNIIKTKFKDICKEYGFEKVPEVIGSPYYSKISDSECLIASEYTDAECKALLTCAQEIKNFSIYD